MTQQVINIGAAPDDSTGDPLRTSFDKTNENFTELYTKGATEGLWNYNQTSTDTSTSPVSGRFKTNSGNYRDATQIAIHAITIQGIDRSSTLRTLLAGDLIQCQDSTNPGAWCRYSLGSSRVDHGTWFQLNVALQADGAVSSGDNQEIVFVFTANGGGGGGGAPIDSPTFTGDPKAPTPTAGDNDTSIATTAFVQAAISQVGSGGGVTDYLFNTSTSEPPGSGQIRFNQTAQSTTTLVWVHNVTAPGVDVKRFLQSIGIGTMLIIQDKDDSSKYINFKVTGASVDKTTYWQFPVVSTVAGSALSGQRVLMAIDSGATKAPIDSPAFTGDPTAPTPATADNDTSIATTAFVKAQSYITSSALAPYALLASPAFSGNPTAPTPTAGDNDTSVATTAFVTTAIVGKADTSALTAKADLASPTFTGDPKAPTPTAGDNDTSIATTAFVTAAVAAVGGSSLSPPQGRLTLQTATPVMTTTQSAKTTIYYTPYQGNLCPIYDGTNFAMSAFSELSVATTDATKSPAAIGASKVNDWFVWNDAGTIRLGHGPDWTSDTARSAGTALVLVNGIWLNNAAITNGPAASRGTYVGTTRSNASSQLDWIIGGAGVGGVQGNLHVWNCYNRVLAGAASADSRASWTYNGTSWRHMDASNLNGVSFVRGLNEDVVTAQVHVTASGGTSGDYLAGLLLDSATPLAASYGSFGTSSAPYEVNYTGSISLGYHLITAAEKQVTTTTVATAFGVVAEQVQGFSLSTRM